MHHTVNFPEFHVDWMSPEEVYLHRENAPSQIYRGISASLGFKKPPGNRLFRGYKELCQHNGTYKMIVLCIWYVHTYRHFFNTDACSSNGLRPFYWGEYRECLQK